MISLSFVRNRSLRDFILPRDRLVNNGRGHMFNRLEDIYRIPRILLYVNIVNTRMVINMYSFVKGLLIVGCFCERVLLPSVERLWDFHVPAYCKQETNNSGYIIFNIATIFVITWLFFGGYKKFIPTKAVNKVRQHGKSVSDEEKGQSQDEAGTNQR